MLFNSLVFAIFLAVVLPLYYSLRLRAQNALLLVASYFFYGWWDWRFLSLLAISTVVDFIVSQRLPKADTTARRKGLLLISLCVNLGLLGFFKYFNFFIESAEVLLNQCGFEANVPLLQVILPVGISFYTFQTMAYTIDVYRGRQQPTNDFLAFAVYVSYFPQLVAGPIERARRLLPQIQKPRTVTNETFCTGIQLILFGLLKKVAIADAIAPIVNAAFEDPSKYSSFMLVIGVYLFAIQIYCDFSGYSDIARGVSRLLGIELIINFRQPYLSKNITEFWRRWHISLSSWLRDYLYIPLGGNRKGTVKTYRNLMLTMLLGGLWHGAGWTFVIWGGLHGLYLAMHKLWAGKLSIDPTETPGTLRGWVGRLLGILLTFHLVCLTWIFFRAPDFASAWAYLVGIGQFTTDIIPGWVLAAGIYLPLIALTDFRCWLRDEQVPVDTGTPWLVRAPLYAIAVLMLLYVGIPNVVPFIYFQF